ncbi:hypothetical protein R6Q59_010307 [Mikania micrantha]
MHWSEKSLKQDLKSKGGKPYTGLNQNLLLLLHILLINNKNLLPSKLFNLFIKDPGSEGEVHVGCGVADHYNGGFEEVVVIITVVVIVTAFTVV